MEGLRQYFARRVIQAAVVLCLVSLAGFSLLHLAPGGPAAIYALSPTMSAEDLDRITREFGLDRPIHVQYLSWAKGFLTGNWGRSYRDGRVVLEVIADRVPATVVLMLSAFSVAVLLGLATGIVSAIRQYSLFDHLTTLGAMVALSIPTFWLGLMAIYVFSELLRALPPGNIGTVGAPFALADRLRHNNAQSYFTTAPWVAIFPGVMITLAVTGFNFLGDGLRDALDPRHVRSRT